MSANLLDGVKPEITQYGSMTDGVITSSTPKDGWKNAANWPITSEAFAENQTMHLGISAKWHGKAATTGVAYAAVKYVDAAGSINNANAKISGITTEWKRFSLSAVIPSGMHIVDFHISGDKLDAAYDATNPVLSYGSPVTLASSAHTPYATQDHLRSEYATKAALKVTSDAVTAEVEERGKLAGRVGTLESTSGTHASRLEQLASSIRSLVKGESTYTDPDGKSATSGIYSLVTQTRDSVTALFGSYTKTADLASTQAVKDAKKAGTDAQAAASAAASAASRAQSTADGAKSTADSLATLIRADSTGITVGKSADGKTWSTGRTHMTADAYQILDKAGTVITQLASDGASFLSGLVRIVAGKVSLPGADSVDSITIDAGGGVATVSGLISRLSGLYNGISSTVTAGFATYGGNGITATVRDTKSNIVANAILGVDEATVGIGGQYVKMKGDAFELSRPDAMRSAIGLGMQRLYYDYDAGWVVYASDYLVWIYAWGVTTGSDSWGSKTCPYVLPEKYRPKLSHITTPVITNNGGSWTGSLAVKSDGTITVSNMGNAGSTDSRYGLLCYPVGV